MITVTKKSPVVALCDNPMLFEFTTDLPSGTDDMFILVQPWFSSDNTVAGEEKLFPPLPGAADVYLQEYLRTGLTSLKQFVFPEQGNAPWLSRNLIREYKLRIQECYMDDGDPVVVTSWLEDRYVVRGKIPRWISAYFYSRWTSYWDWVVSQKAFLTFSPKTLYTRPEQMQKLYFMVYWANQAGEKLTLKLNIRFTDGTTADYAPAQETAEISRYEIYEFSVGPSVLGLINWAATNHPGKEIAGYRVTVMSGSTAVSETRSYILNHAVDAGIEIIFANSAGGYDTLLAYGKNELQSEYDFENVDQQSPGVSNLPEKVQHYSGNKIVRTCRTGYISAEMAQYMPELFESKERYEVSGSALVPIVLLNAKVVTAKDNENLFYAEFEYEYALNQKVEVG